MRLSTHVYNTPDEVDLVVGLLAEAAESGVAGAG